MDERHRLHVRRWRHRRGDTIRFRTRGADRDSLIASCEPGRSIVLRSQQGGVTADYVYSREPVGETATRVTLVADATSAACTTACSRR